MDERRTGGLFAAVLVGLLLLLSSQVPASRDRQRTQLEEAGLRVVGPLARGVTAVSTVLENVTDELRGQSALKEENARLKEEIQRLQEEQMRLRGLESELDLLAEAVSYTPPGEGSLQLADVVYMDPSSWVRTLVLYVPSAAAKDQPVLTAQGLVGRVALVSGAYAKVQLITDRAAAVGAMVQRTRRQGVVRGTADGGLELLYMARQADVAPGDAVVTSGIDGIYPRNIPVATVRSVEPGNGLFWNIQLEPAVDFEVLTQAYLLRREPIPAPLREGGGR